MFAAWCVARTASPGARFRLLPSDALGSGPYALHAALDWDSRALTTVLAYEDADVVARAYGHLCKLRSTERNLLGDAVARGTYAPRSILVVHLRFPDTLGRWRPTLTDGMVVVLLFLFLLVAAVLALRSPNRGHR